MQRTMILGVSVVLLMVPGEVSWAESLGSGAVVQPLSRYAFPVESGLLESRIELQTMHVHTSDPSGGDGLDSVLFSLEGQTVLKGKLELGLTLPFFEMYLAEGEAEGVSFGNLLFNLKARVAGEAARSFAVAVFVNTMLPTHTGVEERGYANFHSGAAVTFWRGRFTYGGDIGLLWAYNDEVPDALVHLIDLFGGVRLHRLVSASLALQMGVPIYPVVDAPALALSPGVQLTTRKGFIMGAALRVAANDSARAYNDGGRLGLMINIGYRQP